MNNFTEKKTRGYLILITLVFIISVLISLIININHARHTHEELAIEMGRSFFRTVLITRKWNALHGGVYVPATEELQSNPFLDDPLRDVTTTEGMKLTKINPAYMTRLISEIMKRDTEIEIHITSLNPIRPGNKPFTWEVEPLEHFEKGTSDEFTKIDKAVSPPVFRYMAPLTTERACLKCHGKYGYDLGDIRGGISFSFSYAPFLINEKGQRNRLLAVHGIFFVLGTSIIGLLGRRLLLRVRELQDALSHIKTLEGILPICSHCKKIKKEDGDHDDHKSWVPVDHYVREKTNAEFSHGLCPECFKEHYPEIYRNRYK